MAMNVDKQLLQAVLEPRKPGAINAIGKAIEAGADPNALTPDTSTSTGHVPAGRTLLTHAIHEWSSNAVSKLLECGADPSLRDALGWTPWMASTLVDESKRRRIQNALEEYAADKTGAYIGDLARAVHSGDISAAESLTQSDDDFVAVASFRVDLVGHQNRGGSPEMLEFLLSRGMQASSTNLLNAIRADNAATVTIILKHGCAPERDGELETPLMIAASMGNLEIVQALVEAGADVNRYADDPEWTPAKYASSNGHSGVSEWLESRMSQEAVDHVEALAADRNPKFKALYDVGTAAEGRSTDHIVSVLEAWDARCGLRVIEARGDMVKLELDSQPDDMDGFIAEAVALCPDLDEDPDWLRSSLVESRQLMLWWD